MKKKNKQKEQTISEITKKIIKFSDERGWVHENPQQLLNSVMIELGELAEHYQWLSKFPDWDEKKKLEVGYEFVDVIFYLFRLAKRSGVDIESSFNSKLPKLAKKFPVGQTSNEMKQVKEEYRKTGKNKLYE